MSSRMCRCAREVPSDTSNWHRVKQTFVHEHPLCALVAAALPLSGYQFSPARPTAGSRRGASLFKFIFVSVLMRYILPIIKSPI